MPVIRRGVDLGALASGSVRAKHVVMLFALVYFLAFAAAYWLSRGIDPLYRPVWQVCLWQVTQFAFLAIATACVPELRRLFFEITQEGGTAHAVDVLAAIAVMVAWGLGASRILFHYPLFLYDADAAYRLLDFGRKLDAGPIYALLGTVSATVLAPICEEIIFRGYLLNLWLARHRMWFAVCSSSILFGLWHFKNAPFATGMGFFLALVYLKYRSLLLCIVLHAFYNLLVNRMVLPQVFWDKDRSSVTALSSWSTELWLTALFLPALAVFWQRFRPQSESNS